MDTPKASVRPSKLDDEEPLLPRRGPPEEAKFDITAMIDLVFMLNIFFLVTTVTAALSEMDLPVVRHCVPTDADSAVVVSMTSRDRQDATLYLGDSPDGAGIVDAEEQTRSVRDAAEDGWRSGKRILLIKAERSVKLRDVGRIAGIVHSVPGMELRMAVIEKE